MDTLSPQNPDAVTVLIDNMDAAVLARGAEPALCQARLRAVSRNLLK